MAKMHNMVSSGLYVTMKNNEGNIDINVFGDEPTIDCDVVFSLRSKEEILDLINNGRPPEMAREWIYSQDKFGAEYIDVTRDIKRKIDEFFVELSGGIFEPGDTVAATATAPFPIPRLPDLPCPLCHKSDSLYIGYQDCPVHGKEPQSFISCGCGYGGPEGSTLAEGIDLWDSGERDPLSMLIGVLKPLMKRDDLDSVGVDLMSAITSNSHKCQDIVIRNLSRRPDLKAAFDRFLSDVAHNANAMREKLKRCR